VATGLTIVVPTARDPDAVCALIAKHRVNVLPASPTFLNLILLSGACVRHDLRRLKLVTYGTEPMPEGLLARLKAALPGARFLQTFGTSETGIVRTASKSSTSTLMRIDDPHQEYRIVDGELWLRSGTQILGYLNASSDRFTEDGWFCTGDLVEEADDGYLRIVGRREEIINVGGQKVLPSEVESVLLAMPAIADCAVRGERNAITGQAVVADVVLAPQADPQGIRQQVRRHCRARLERYKVPAKVAVVEKTRFSDRFKKRRGG
jgi:acyl-coenzyme A synthetase/AMP-(fatty) acid ligase